MFGSAESEISLLCAALLPTPVEGEEARKQAKENLVDDFTGGMSINSKDGVG